MPWCIPCGEKRGHRNYVSAAEAGIVTLARAALAAGSPFIGQPCPQCGAALEAGEEVEGCDVTLRHVCCPATRAIKAIEDRAKIAATAPMVVSAAREFVAPILGWDANTGREVRWPAVGPGALPNSNIAVGGTSGAGKTAFVQALLVQLARRNGTCFGVTDFKDDYLPLADDAELVDLWRDGLVYNPLALEDDSRRAVDRAVIEIRDAVTAAARSCSVRLGHRQLDRLRTALTEIYGTCRADGRWPTMLDLDAALGDDLSAAIGDLTRNEIFRDGPPLGRAMERSLVFGLAGIPGGSGITQTLATGFILSSLMLRIHATPTRPDTMAYALAIDEAHRVAGFKAVDTLIREGRSKGLAMIVATQQPDDMPAVVAANAATQICFGQPDAATAAVAAKRLDPTDATLAARIRRLGTGRAVVRLGRGRLSVVDMMQFHRDGGRLGDNGTLPRPESMPPASSEAPSKVPVKRDPVRRARRDQAAMVPSGRRSRDPDDEDDDAWERRLRRAAW